MVTRQVKGLGVCNEPTCLGPHLTHLYLHFNELKNEKMEEPKKQKTHEKPSPIPIRRRRRRRKQKVSPLP
ncbi:hypothetical protein R1flu_018964 [Riccia fluitans]|uniref:Uncharacterized protein n=1 Tax=Riccia fluitans TaxID=41844 RepID=A0ABD1ZHB8_9MARC